MIELMLFSFELEAVREIHLISSHSESLKTSLVRDALIEVLLDIRKRHSIMRSLRSRDTWLDCVEVQLKHISELDVILSIVVSK